jgi:thiol:disulfide interchange protein
MTQSITTLKSRLVAVATLIGLALATACQSPTATNSEASAGEPYDERTSGSDLVDAALQQALAGNKHVILLFGANWCPYCRQLHALLENDPQVSALVKESFVVVPIDVGTSSRNRNTSVIDRYGATVFTDGVPSVVVIDAKGKRLAPTRDNPWSAKNRIEADRVITFLKKGGG